MDLNFEFELTLSFISLATWETAEHFEHQVGAEQRRITRRVVGRRHLDEVRADEIQAPCTTNDLEAL